MMSLRQAFPAPVVVLLSLVAAAQFVLAVQLGSSRVAPHDAVVMVSAPPIVAQEMVARANSLPGHAVEAHVAPVHLDPRAAVRDGVVPAAVLVDLAGDQDTLLVSTTADPRLVRALTVRLAALDSTWGRTVVVDRVPPADNPGTRRGDAYLIAAGWVVAGFLLAALVSSLRGPVPPTWRRGVARVLGLAGACAVLSLLATVVLSAHVYDGAAPELWALGFGTMLAGAWTTLALESLAGLAGIGAATVVFLLLAAPLASLRDLALLPEPWATLTPLTPHGAALEALSSTVYYDRYLVRPTLVLLVWTALPVLTMALGRRERGRDLAAVDHAPAG